MGGSAREVPLRHTLKAALAALAAFALLAALAPAAIDRQSGTTFDATAGEEFSGTVAEFHADSLEPAKEQFEARIHWGDGTEKTDGIVAYKGEPGATQDFLVQGTHTYRSGGTCRVTVEIKQPQPDGQVVTLESTANVAGPPGPECGESRDPRPDPPKARIAALAKKPRQSSVTLFSPRVTPGSTSITNFRWDFGDGESADLPQGSPANHIYDEPGTYNVSLTVTDATGRSDTATTKIRVRGDPRAVISIKPKGGPVGTRFALRGNRSSVAGGRIVRWEWECNGRRVVSSTDRSECTPTSEKNAAVHLTVTTDQGDTSSASTAIPVSPRSTPKAAFEFAPEHPERDQEVTFDASASSGDISRYRWDWGDGTTDETTGPVARHTFAGKPGARLVKLTVTGAGGTSSVKRRLHVTTRCVNDITVRGLRLRSGCFRRTLCQDGRLRCWGGEPNDPTKLHGVDITPLEGARLEIDPATGDAGTGIGRLRASYGLLPLGDGSFTIPKGGGPKVVEDSWRVASKIHGFEARSDPVVFRPDGSSSLPINLKLPPPLSQISGHLDLGASNDDPVFLGNLHVEAHDMPFPPFHLNSLVFDYNGANRSWFGSMSVDTPTGTFGGSMGFDGSKFDHLGLDGENLSLPFGDFIFLERIEGSYLVGERRIDAGISLTVGPALHIPGLGSGPLLNIDGKLSLVFPESGGWSAAVSGNGSMVAAPAGLGFNASVESTGRFEANFRFDATLAGYDINTFMKIIYFNLALYQANAEMDLCTQYIVHGCQRGEVVVSSVGVTVCIDMPWSLPDVGGFLRWGVESFEFFFDGCSVGGVTTDATRIGPGQSRAFTVPKGTRSEVLAFEGRGGPPDVTLRGPGGQRMTTPADGYDVTKPFLVSQEKQDRKTYVMISAPRTGKWTVSVAPGSTPVVRMQRAQGLPKPKVRARVTGSGAKRRLEWSATPIQGQRIVFSQQGSKTGDVIGATTKASGSLPFTATDGPRGKRKIVAEVLQGGKPRANLNVGSFTTARIGPGKVRGLKLTRRGSNLEVTWDKATGATGYDVQVVLSDGRRIPKLTAKRRLTIPGFAKSETASVTVAGYRIVGLDGHSAKATIGPAKPSGKKG